MFTTEITKLKTVCLHHIGSHNLDEGIILSNDVLKIDADSTRNLMTYCFSSFKEDNTYNFYNDLGLSYNEAYGCIKAVFENPQNILEQSKYMAKFLYDTSNHPNIKSGDFIMAYFTDCEIGGVMTDAVGLFKSENTESFLNVVCDANDASITSMHGLGLKHVDKAALVFNVNQEDGYTLAVIDNTNGKNEAKYWIDGFLHVRLCTDDYLHTQTMMSAVKSYFSKQMSDGNEMTKAEQAVLIDKSVKYFRENEKFDVVDFEDKVIGDNMMKYSFDSYVDEYVASQNLDVNKNFNISAPAVRKQTRNIKSVIKLDKNFHIYIHGGENMIKRGIDEESGLSYYQLFFKEEQ